MYSDLNAFLSVDFTERFAVGICHTPICLMAAPDPSLREPSVCK
uniref:Uncharacterized protein n=1 Tax=Anguilla anguilla TaxID=7936 RepID=A0A0E9QCZ3_ANGAN